MNEIPSAESATMPMWSDDSWRLDIPLFPSRLHPDLSCTSFPSMLNSCASPTRGINHKGTKWDQPVSKLCAELKLLHYNTCEPNRTPGMFFCMVIMWSTFSQGGWHTENQAGNSWWLRIRFGPGEWSWLGRAASGPGRRSKLQCIPAAWRTGEKSPPLRRQMELNGVLQIVAVKTCQEFIILRKRHPADGKDMIWMQNCLISPKVQVWHACNFPTVHQQQQHKTMSGWKYPQSQRGSKPSHGIIEEDGSRYTAHADIIYN